MPTLDEAIEKFYKLKQKYEANYRSKILTPILTSELSAREKRAKLRNSPKPKCVNCGREVGTVFSITIDSEHNDDKHFIAKCGDLQDPCPLSIDLYYSPVYRFNKILDEDLTVMESIKKDIIKAKNDLLFGYKNQESGFTTFEESAKKLNEIAQMYNANLEDYIMATDDPKDAVKLNELKKEFGVKLKDYSSILASYKTSLNQDYINNAVEYYINEIKPIEVEMRNLKYRRCTIEYDAETAQYFLMQRKNESEDMEYNLNEKFQKERIKSYVVDVKMAKKKTKKAKEIVLNKTLKVSPAIEEVEGEGEAIDVTQPKVAETEIKEQQQPAEEKKTYDPTKYHYNQEKKEWHIPERIHTIGKNTKMYRDEQGNVKWTIPRFEEIWNQIPAEVKRMIGNNRMWAEEYVEHCSNMRSQKQPCRLILPSDIILPPRQDDGFLMFNEPFIERYFNNSKRPDLREKGKTLLDPRKSRDEVEQMLIEMLERELGGNYQDGNFLHL